MQAPGERRLFIGLGLEEEPAERLLRRIRPHLEDAPGVRVYAAADLHLTLCFLGAFQEQRRSQLQSVLQEELRGLDAPELVLDGIDAFPDAEHPRAIYARVDEADPGSGRLWALRNRVWQACLSQGWRPVETERRREFRPHVTVARLSADRAQGGLDRGLRRLEFDQRWLPVDVHLFESRPQVPEERYQALVTVPLVVRPG